MNKSDKKFNLTSSKIDKIVENLLSEVRERPQKILIKRFGLDGKKPQVLDQIGKKFGVTRERIRQIEADSFSKLREVRKNDELQALVDRASEIVEEKGGFCEKRALKESLVKNIKDSQRNQLMFVLNSAKELKFKKGNLKVDGFWFLRGDDIDKKIVQTHKFILDYLKNQGEPLSFGKILSFLENSEWKDFFAGETGKSRLKMILRASRMLSKNILGEWGLKNWKVISERGSREKAYLVLRKHKKPLHFRDITDLINGHWSDREALPQTVHNELIKDERFVLIGRGIYGLDGWGYPAGTVKEVIVSFLLKKEGPIEKEEIVSHVLSKKQVKEATILVTLTDKSIFDRTDDGLIVLRSA